MADEGFLGTGWSFPPEFGSNGSNVKMVDDETDVEQALRILFSTALEERLYRPEYGCDLRRFMFEEINNDLASQIQEMIVDAIDEYESRIDLLRMEIKESDNASQLLMIHIEYQIRETNSIQNMVFPLNLGQ
ncbi:MAG: GPW/gp25 family protein [Proteobacteria bacterium]|nr:GPW/gp25 family protein [Pseudomonadota bacterium]